MANKIATIDDIATHIWKPDTVGRNRCVTPTILHNQMLQSEIYSIKGSYANNRLVPLNNITFYTPGVYLSICIFYSSNISAGQYTTINATGAGLNVTKQINSNSGNVVVLKKHLCGDGDTIQIKITNSPSFSTSGSGVKISIFCHENTTEIAGILPVINNRGSERFLVSGVSIEDISGRHAYSNITANNSIDSTITFTSSANKKLTVIVTKE